MALGLGDPGVDPLHECADDRGAPLVVRGQLGGHVTVKREQPRRAIHRHATGADERRHRSRCAASPEFELEEAVARHRPSLRKEQVVLAGGGDVHDPGRIAGKCDRGAHTASADGIALGHGRHERQGKDAHGGAEDDGRHAGSRRQREKGRRESGNIARRAPRRGAARPSIARPRNL